MVELVAVKTSDLAGAALDWAVAKADGEKLVEADGKHSVITGYRLNPIRVIGGYTPSTDWNQGGPFIFEYRLNLIEVNEDCWEAWVSGQEDRRYQGGDSPLVAICRAVVASQLGDTVSVPKELLGVTRSRLYTIWTEGYRATGESATATCHGEYEGETFSDAVVLYLQTLGQEDRAYYRQHEDGTWTCWGCRLFDNETDARRAYG